MSIYNIRTVLYELGCIQLLFCLCITLYSLCEHLSTFITAHVVKVGSVCCPAYAPVPKVATAPELTNKCILFYYPLQLSQDEPQNNVYLEIKY